MKIQFVEKKRIAYIVNHVAFFASHRLPLAIGARKVGFDIRLFTGQAGSEEMERTAVDDIKKHHIDHARVAFKSSGTNIILELIGLFNLLYLLIKYNPDIVHCASPKGVIYGGIAARICNTRGLVLAISGMGYAHTTASKPNFFRYVYKYLYDILARVAFNHKNLRIIVQNNDDYNLIINKKLAKEDSLIMIPGSGVDLTLYTDCTASKKRQLVLLPARMLEDKGVTEFVNAVRLIKRSASHWQFLLAGAAGYDNPSAIPESDLLSWQAEGLIEWLGHVDDMLPLYRDAAIVCLPSYREGMPKALLEAAAAGCAVITTDVIGCREAIEAGLTGDLVPVRDVDALASTLLSLIKDKERTKAYGEMGQKRAQKLFSVTSVISQTLDIYEGLLNHE